MNNLKLRYYYTLEEAFEAFTLNAIQTLINEATASAPELEEEFGDVLNILNDEYYDWYIGFVDIMAVCPITDTPQPTAEQKAALKKKFLRKLITKYNFTKDRYIYLLNLYEEQKEHLMDQLKSTTNVEELGNNSSTTTRTDNLAFSKTTTHTGTDGLSESTTGTNEHRVNDTPQNGGTWTNDKHTSVYETTDITGSKSSTNTKNLTDSESGTNTGTQTTGITGQDGKDIETVTETDPMTIMARINEIQDHYMNVLKNWCKEFDQLFIPPYNEFENDDSEE